MFNPLSKITNSFLTGKSKKNVEVVGTTFDSSGSTPSYTELGSKGGYPVTNKVEGVPINEYMTGSGANAFPVTKKPVGGISNMIAEMQTGELGTLKFTNPNSAAVPPKPLVKAAENFDSSGATPSYTNLGAKADYTRVKQHETNKVASSTSNTGVSQPSLALQGAVNAELKSLDKVKATLTGMEKSLNTETGVLEGIKNNAAVSSITPSEDALQPRTGNNERILRDAGSNPTGNLTHSPITGDLHTLPSNTSNDPALDNQMGANYNATMHPYTKPPLVPVPTTTASNGNDSPMGNWLEHQNATMPAGAIPTPTPSPIPGTLSADLHAHINAPVDTSTMAGVYSASGWGTPPPTPSSVTATIEAPTPTSVFKANTSANNPDSIHQSYGKYSIASDAGGLTLLPPPDSNLKILGGTPGFTDPANSSSVHNRFNLPKIE